MSKGLRNMSKEDRARAIQRRIASQSMGLGYWGALDARVRQLTVEIAAKKAAEAKQGEEQ